MACEHDNFYGGQLIFMPDTGQNPNKTEFLKNTSEYLILKNACMSTVQPIDPKGP